MDLGSKDYFSILPDALVCHILSFLSTKDAALTSVLSKRWRNLLAFVPNLDFDNMIYDYPKMGRRERLYLLKSFTAFVDRVLSLQGNAPLNKFSLRCKIGSDPSLVIAWILHVLNRGVVELDLYISSTYNFPLPPEVLICKTLVKLQVEGTNDFTIDVREVFLPKLKALHINDVLFIDQRGPAFAKLISGCYALEELVMTKVDWDDWDSFTVSNPTLKRVIIDCCEESYKNPKSVSFDTPNLVYLVFTTTVALKYPKLNFDSLVEASVGLQMTPNQVFRGREVYRRHGYKRCRVGNAAEFLMGICNVKILYLSSEALEVLTSCCKAKAIPVFNNLIHLTIKTHQEVDWDSLPNLLGNCPNLDTLVFEGLHYVDTNQCGEEDFRFNDTNSCFDKNGVGCLCKPWYDTPIGLSSSPVKMLKVLKFGEMTNDIDDIDKQIELIKYFVETMPNLEDVILYYDTTIDCDMRIVSTQLQMLEKVASPKCKIQVISDNISFSFTVQSSSSTSGLVFFKQNFRV